MEIFDFESLTVVGFILSCIENLWFLLLASDLNIDIHTNNVTCIQFIINSILLYNLLLVYFLKHFMYFYFVFNREKRS